MKNIESLLEKFKPSWEEQEKYGHIAARILHDLFRICEEKGIDADPILVGSFAKDTNLRGGDLDIFVRFSKKYTAREMEKLGLELGRAVVSDPQAKYAEHPYISGYQDGVKVDVVPCFRIDKSSEMVSSVDRTPLHTRYVNSHLSEEQKDEVRRLKLLLKSLGIYGSEIYRNGFSGYVCELLIDRYGTYRELISNFAEMRGRLVIPKGALHSGKFTSPFVLMDPCDDNRNAAASVSLESFSKLKMAAKLISSGVESIIFNGTEARNASDILKRHTAFRIFRIPHPGLVPDTVYPQAVKFREVIVSILHDGGFIPVSSAIDITEDIDVMVECERAVVPRVVRHQGPSVDMPNSIDFLMKWRGKKVMRGPYIQGDRLYVEIERECTVLEDCVMRSIGSYDIGKNLNLFREQLKILDPVQDRALLETKVVDTFVNEIFPRMEKIVGIEHLSAREDL